MKTLWLISCSLTLMAASGGGQSSQDHWDSMFHRGALQRRTEHKHQEWLNSWKDRSCTGADVKQFWLMTLTQIVPDSMDSRYYAVLKQNTALEEALQSTLYDFEAQDIADEINIMGLRREGKLAEATALEKLRLERIRIHQQQQFQAEVRAPQRAMQQELVALREEVVYLQAVARQASIDAQMAKSRAEEHR
jgi:hypothetical protein